MARIVGVLTPEEQHELVRLMKKLGKHAMTTYAKPAADRNGGGHGPRAATRQAAVS